MDDWETAVARLAHGAETRLDTLKARLAARRGPDDPLMIVPYVGYGNRERLIVRGRVLENKGSTSGLDNDDVWDNLLDMYRRFATDELPFPQVEVRDGESRARVTGNEEGFFRAELRPAEPLPEGELWHAVETALLTDPRITATAHVYVPPTGARCGIISDLDDTVVQSHATDLLQMARTVFLSNAFTRLPFPGVAAFYRALHTGGNPLFYLSSSPWNLYDLFVDFFALRQIPLAPLFLRDWGISQSEQLPTQHKQYKLGVLRELFNFYPDLPFILIGDSGQKDPEIYAEIVTAYPGRVLAIYIRDVSEDAARDTAVQELARRVAAAGSTLLLAADTRSMARHAAQQGWIAATALSEIEQSITL